MGYGKKGWKRAGFRGSRDKYSVETRAGSITTDVNGDAGETIVPATTLQGMRKVKHLTISMADTAGINSNALFWAIVYVPQGTAANTLTVDSSSSLYEPNQFVMGTGVFDFSAGPLRVHCPLSRNLNSGDSIALIVHCETASGAVDAATFKFVVKYAITLQ